MHNRRDRPKIKTRDDALRDALVPLAAKGVSAEEALALILASSAALSQGVGIGWPAIDAIIETVFTAGEAP